MHLDAGVVASLYNAQLERGASAQVAATYGLKNGKPAMNEAQAEKAAKDFESMFISQMMELMFGDSIGESAFGDKETTEIYKGWMVGEYGKAISGAGGIGIASHVKKHLLSLQEV